MFCPGQMLQATALVHEAYLSLVDDEKAQHWDSRGQFFAATAETMCRMAAGAVASICRTPFPLMTPLGDLLALDEVLTRLAAREPAKRDGGNEGRGTKVTKLCTPVGSFVTATRREASL